MPDTARSTVVSHVIGVHNRVLAHDVFVDVGVVNDGRIHAHDGGVVRESSTAPFAADEANTHVPEAVINPAVVAHFIAPIAVVKAVMAIVPTPPRRSP